MNMDEELFLKLVKIRQAIDEFNELVKQKSTLKEPSVQDVARLRRSSEDTSLMPPTNREDVVSSEVTSSVIEQTTEKKPRGRPKKYTEEELKERHKQQAMEYNHRTESRYKCYGGKPIMTVEERALKKKEHNQKYYAKIRANREKIHNTGFETLQ